MDYIYSELKRTGADSVAQVGRAMESFRVASSPILFFRRGQNGRAERRTLTNRDPRASRQSVIGIRTHPVMHIAALVGVLFLSCSSRPAEISLARLVQEQEAFFGDEIETRGTVREFEDASGSYYVLEDESRNRVALVPASKVRGLIGEEVTVTGKFEFKPAFGRVIEVRRIVPEPGRAVRGGEVHAGSRPGLWLLVSG